MLQIVFATTTTTVSNGPGSHTVVHEGEHWWAGDPIVKAHPDLFTKNERNGLCSSVPLPEADEQEEETHVADTEWDAAVQALKDAGVTPETAAALAEAARKTADDEKEAADASQPQAPVEQATKAPGEKSTARRGNTQRG